MNRFIAPLVVLAILTCATLASACPLCSESIPNSDAQSASTVPEGFNISIFSMLGGLMVVMGSLGFFVVRTIRSTDRAMHTRLLLDEAGRQSDDHDIR